MNKYFVLVFEGKGQDKADRVTPKYIYTNDPCRFNKDNDIDGKYWKRHIFCFHGSEVDICDGSWRGMQEEDNNE